jgi:hypothetical protein
MSNYSKKVNAVKDRYNVSYKEAQQMLKSNTYGGNYVRYIIKKPSFNPEKVINDRSQYIQNIINDIKRKKEEQKEKEKVNLKQIKNNKSSLSEKQLTELIDTFDKLASVIPEVKEIINKDIKYISMFNTVQNFTYEELLSTNNFPFQMFLRVVDAEKLKFIKDNMDMYENKIYKKSKYAKPYAKASFDLIGMILKYAEI